MGKIWNTLRTGGGEGPSPEKVARFHPWAAIVSRGLGLTLGIIFLLAGLSSVFLARGGAVTVAGGIFLLVFSAWHLASAIWGQTKASPEHGGARTNNRPL